MRIAHLFPRLRRDNPADSTAAALDRLHSQLTNLARQSGRLDPVLERQARIRLERMVDQLAEILRQELSFTQTETWRTVYEAILSGCQTKRYLSVALIEHEDYWQDQPGLASLDTVAARIAECTRCPLCEGRTTSVPGEGDPDARLMLVGEGPGQQEDATGRPFVGAAGGLLDSILSAIEIPRERVFIANVVKCRPPKNRTPLPDEQAACLPRLV